MRTRAARRRYQIREIYAFQRRSQSWRNVFNRSLCPKVRCQEILIIDEAAVVNMFKPGTERTFFECAAGSFIRYIRAQLSDVNRLDIVWDEYLENRVKATTRGRRGSSLDWILCGMNTREQFERHNSGQAWFWCTTMCSGRQQASKKLEGIPTSGPEQARIV